MKVTTMKKLIIAFMLLAPVAVFAQKFGYVETQKILAVRPEAKKINEDLEKLTK